MKITFIGTAVDNELLKRLPDASIAGNKMQLGFIYGFKKNNIEMDVVSIEPQKMWSFNFKPIFVKEKKLAEGDILISTLSYCNVPILKQISIKHAIKQALKKTVNDDSILIVYNTMSIFAKPVLQVAKKYSCKCGAVIADLPIKRKKGLFRLIEDKRQISYIDRFDFILPITKLIHTDYAPNTPSQVIEGGCFKDNPIFNNSENENHTGQKRIIFSGTINALSGLELLIKAMDYVEENIILDIYGKGPDEQKIRHLIENKKNIIYHGFVSNSEMTILQKNADLLACPRKADNYITKYTFPSKILEYLTIGVPIISNWLPGFPIDYKDLLNIPNSESPQDWGKMINSVLNKNSSYYQQKAIFAKTYCQENKNWETQTKKVLSLISTIKKKDENK